MFNRQQRQIQAAKNSEKDKVNVKPVPAKKTTFYWTLERKERPSERERMPVVSSEAAAARSVITT